MPRGIGIQTENVGGGSDGLYTQDLRPDKEDTANSIKATHDGGEGRAFPIFK